MEGKDGGAKIPLPKSRKENESSTNSNSSTLNNMNQLKDAKKYLNPIIDEIVNQTTSYNPDDLAAIMANDLPMCSISSLQFSNICDVSKIMHDVIYNLNEGPTHFENVIVNRVQEVPIKNMKVEDANTSVVYIDADLMKKLIALHTLLTETLKELENENNKEFSLKQDQNKKKAEEIRKENRSVRDSLEPHFIISGDDYRGVMQNPSEFERSKDAIALEKELRIIPGTSIEAPKQKIEVIEESNLLIKEKMNKSTSIYDLELIGLKEMHKVINKAINKFQKKYSIGHNEFYNDGSIEDVQMKTLAALKELSALKDLMKSMEHPILTLNDDLNSEQHCCKYYKFPHIHSLLNDLPVVIRMSSDVLDYLIAEEDKENMINLKQICQCNHERKMKEKNYFETRNVKINNSRLPYVHESHSNIIFNVASSPFLSYKVNKTSLTRIDVCSSLHIETGDLKEHIRDEEINHPKPIIKNQLKVIGIDSLIKISKPAKCCRNNAVINEAITETEPFHPSLNSLPLTPSDLNLINEILSYNVKCTNNTNSSQTIFEYYTNFQENFASNVNYFLPIKRIYEVRFFFFFKKSDQEQEKKKKVKLKESFNDLYRRFIYNKSSNGSIKEIVNVPKSPKLTRNKKCQVNTRKTVLNIPEKVKMQEASAQTVHFKKSGTKKVNEKKKKINGNLEGGDNSEMFADNSSLTTIKPLSHDLGTIYESDEKQKNSELAPNISYDSLIEFLRSPDISNSFQKFITTPSAIKAFEKNKINVEQFWNIIFDAKKSNMSLSRSSKSSENLPPKFSTYHPHGKPKKKSKIPKRILTDSSSSLSCQSRSAKFKAQKKIPVPAFSSKPYNKSSMLKRSALNQNKKCFNSNIEKENKPNSNDGDMKNIETKNKISDSLHELAKKNGPGYISVLHPICGCPEVSIYIPCYCEGKRIKELPKEQLEEIAKKEKGMHIILPRKCRLMGE